MRFLMFLPLTGFIACTETKTEQGINGTAGGLGEAGTDGADGKDGDPGTDGKDGDAGTPGADGADGADGTDGLHCWDLDGNGEADVDEDTNGDGTVDVLDCRGASGADGADGADGDDGSGGGWSKSDLYTVTGADGPVSTASCDDEDDILLHGGCTTYHNCVPATLTSRPEGADDPSVISSWYCSASCGSGTATAVATCISVDGS